MNTLFPIYIKLDQITTLLIGAGTVALEKLQAILRNSPEAKVKIVAVEVCSDVLKLVSANPLITISQRAFRETDLQGVDLLIMATNNMSLNNMVQKLAKEKHILLNSADKPELCDFYLGSVVQKGNLKIGISTNGNSPTIAKRLREFFEDLLPEEIDETLTLMGAYRDSLKGNFQQKVAQLNEHTRVLVNVGGGYDRAN